MHQAKDGPAPATNSKAVDRLMGSAKLSEATKKGYLMRVNQYLREIKSTPDDLVKQARSHPRKFEEAFIGFLQATGKKSSSSTVTSYRDSVKRFLELNRVEGVNWQYINEYVPSAKKAGQDRAPTIEEIRRMVDVADLRMKCLVLFLCSSGARIGSVQWLKWRDLEETDKNGQKFAKVTIYRGEPDEYLTFITPECYRVLLEYRKRREGIGEEVAPSSFVFATQGNARDFDQSRVKVASVKTLKNQLGALLQQLGMRTVISEREGYRNYEFKQAHGFRKFFKTRMELAGAKPLAIETMMGHGTGVSKSYYKPTADELASEYAKAIPSLTVISGGVTRDDVDAVKREAALEAMRAVATSFGIDPMKVRVEKKRETGRELTGEEELELIRLEIKKLREPEKDPQKIVQEEELDA